MSFISFAPHFFLIGTKCGRVSESEWNVRSDLLCVTLMKRLFVYVCVSEWATIFQVCEVLCSVMMESWCLDLVIAKQTK